MPLSGLFYLNSLNRFISYIRGVWNFFLLLSCFVEISELNANSEGPDQMPHSAASDLGYTVCLYPDFIVPRLFEEKRGDTVFGFPWNLLVVYWN